jgi:hypothetical protein
MNPLVELWVASGLGAALFFAVGYSLAHVLRRTDQVMTDARLAHVQAELEHTQLAYAAQSREVDHLDHRVQRAEQSAGELSDALSQARAECVRLDKELRRHSSATERAAALERENGMLIAQVRARALTSTEAEASELRAKLESEEARSRQLEEELRAQKNVEQTPAVRRQLAELRQRIGETAKARAHWESRARALEAGSKLEMAAEATQAALTAEIQRLKREQRAARARELSERLTLLEQSATENVLLKKQRDALTTELRRMREDQVRASQLPPLTAAAPTSDFILPASSQREVKNSGVAPRMWQEHETLAGMLERQLALLVEHEPGVTAVLCDEQGLPLVGTGPERDQECVSVLTSLAHELSHRARDLVGLGSVELMEMVDSGGRALRVRFFDWEDQPMALGYVGRPQLVQSDDEARMVSTFPKLRVARSA